MGEFTTTSAWALCTIVTRATSLKAITGGEGDTWVPVVQDDQPKQDDGGIFTESPLAELEKSARTVHSAPVVGTWWLAVEVRPRRR